MRNWWYYHKWYVICGIILLGILFRLICNAFGLFEKKPDCQIAYVGKTELPQDTVCALEKAFASISEDFNGDGEVIVQVHQYIDGNQNMNADTAYYEYASEVSLIVDITDCESYIFLMDDPELFQREFHILASPDGSCPDDLDYSADDKTILWTNCSLLSTMDLGSYSTTISGANVSGNNQELLENLYIGRRCFYTDAAVDNFEECSKLWDLLYSNVTIQQVVESLRSN